MRTLPHDVQGKLDDFCFEEIGGGRGGGDGRDAGLGGFGGGVDLEEDVEGVGVRWGEGGELGLEEGGFLDGFEGFESEEVGNRCGREKGTIDEG